MVYINNNAADDVVGSGSVETLRLLDVDASVMINDYHAAYARFLQLLEGR